MTLRGERRCTHVANSAIEQSHQCRRLLSINVSAEGSLEARIHQTIVSFGNMPAGLVDTLKFVNRTPICLIQNRVYGRGACEKLMKVNDTLV
ncbi:MAG: hypothetical protein WDO68_02225 [Gammaproteobacteria bacterium]